MSLGSFLKLNHQKDAMYFKRKLSLQDYQKLMRGLWNKKRYIFYPELNLIMNEYNEKEIYILKEDFKNE